MAPSGAVARVPLAAAAGSSPYADARVAGGAKTSDPETRWNGKDHFTGKKIFALIF